MGKLKINAGIEFDLSSGYRSRFSHKNERSNPGYYSVLLDDYSIKVELTVTERCGFHKYAYPDSDSSQIIIDLIHARGEEYFYIKKLSNN